MKLEDLSLRVYVLHFLVSEGFCISSSLFVLRSGESWFSWFRFGDGEFFREPFVIILINYDFREPQYLRFWYLWEITLEYVEIVL